ncbi:2-amino-4-hydroxy-6-hydroxymethyldihydropteridine diphosphokinase [Parabacteroides sp. PF5-6]|uniref:2-amino-4-hydroxy-6- hydroxymethyldihydropteridine diphosphokinase n=1 Tax=Parabacteroides sp. PF5-6 TaxID=1742403 RepID=UPI002406D83F|nr:2-amino-4-hydroxy-6-hydroxymethyldihydropteridine diphosphokinase [Parabacteroides sp. PF5-6]MDF9831028.1 2-amino-4-hydroxy-6-hydroxymethyldihydropteridine diphosphokinase [Parabacteroides sp. PF5-6]
MGENRIVLSFGSNSDKERNMDRAMTLLNRAFDSILFSERLETAPYGSLAGSAPFLNQLALAYTPLAAEEIVARLKTIEKEIGRRPEDKSGGLIPIDIDLLQWNDLILKPEDLKRNYIQILLPTL